MIEKRCPRCHKNEARVHPVFGILPCLECIQGDSKERRSSRPPEFYSISMQTRVQQQRDAHEKDMLPPYDHEGRPSEEFARAYPEKAKELFGEYEKVTGKTTEYSK